MTSEFYFAEAGETVVLVVGARNIEVVLLEPCPEGGSGHWACTCGEGIMNNMGLGNHEGEGHRLLWVCHEHGPEAVPEDAR